MELLKKGDEDALKSYAYRPLHMWKEMIEPEVSANPVRLQTIPSKPASLGLMDSLPLELVQAIMVLLDFRSVFRIAELCYRGLEVVNSLPELRDLYKYAPQALSALGMARLAGYYTVSTLHDALTSAECTRCGKFGPFLFLPTCSRCCYACLKRDSSLWVAPEPYAMDCFSGSAKNPEHLISSAKLPGEYQVRDDVGNLGLPTPAVSVKAVTESAMQAAQGKHNLLGELQETYRARFGEEGLMFMGPDIAGFLSHVYPIFSALTDNPRDPFPGIASIPMPHLSKSGIVENGIWCKGCLRGLTASALRTIFSQENDVGAEDVDAVMYQSRTRAAFLEHTRHCFGIPRCTMIPKSPKEKTPRFLEYPNPPVADPSLIAWLL